MDPVRCCRLSRIGCERFQRFSRGSLRCAHATQQFLKTWAPRGKTSNRFSCTALLVSWLQVPPSYHLSWKKNTIQSVCAHQGLARILSFYFRGHNGGFRGTHMLRQPLSRTFRGKRRRKPAVTLTYIDMRRVKLCLTLLTVSSRTSSAYQSEGEERKRKRR